jgi:hypothetical protein
MTGAARPGMTGAARPGMTGEELAVTRAAWRIFGDDIDWVVGTA